MTMTATDRIPVTRVQAAFRLSGLTAGQLAVRLEWYTTHNRPDSTRVNRALGLAPTRSHGYVTVTRSMTYERAVMFIRAMDLAPVDFDL